MNEFRDSLAADVTVGFDYAFNNQIPCDVPIAEAVLRSPEMQQIRITLRRMSAVLAHQHVISSEHDDALDAEYRRRDALINYGLPDHVIAWVMAE